MLVCIKIYRWKCCATVKTTVSSLFSIPDYSFMFELSRVQVYRGSKVFSVFPFCMSEEEECLTGDIRWQHLTRLFKWGVHFKKPLYTRYNRGNMPVSTHTTAAVWVANKKKSIFNSVTLSHRGTQAFLRSNRLTPFLWLWCPFCFSSRTTMAKGGKQKG